MLLFKIENFDVNSHQLKGRFIQMNEEVLEKNKQYNLKLYPIYKSLSWDLLFYYAISFLFLTQTKGFSASEAICIDAFYTLFKLILLIPCNLITNKIGERRSMILGNFLIVIYMAIFILANSMSTFIFANIFSAIGYALKGITESNFLYSSISKTENRNSKYSKIDGKASSYYFYIDAITSLSTGFLFVINEYLPMIFCLLINIISTVLACKFKETTPYNITKSKVSVRTELLDIKQGFRFIFKSNRLRHLILFYAVFYAILGELSNLRSSILTDINLPSQYFGILFAVLQVASGIASANSLWFHKKYRNRTLQNFAILLCFAMLVIGFSGLSIDIIGFMPCAIIMCIMFIIQSIVKGPFHTLIKMYLNSFASHTVRTKILSAADLTYEFIRSILSFSISAMLGILSTSYVFIIIGCISSLFFTILLDKMRYTVGLKPEEYKKADIEFTEVH